MRDLIADWALRRARTAVDTASTARDPRHARQRLSRSRFWHDSVLWLDGLAPFPADPETRGMLRDEAIAWLWIWAAVAVLACAALLDGGGP